VNLSPGFNILFKEYQLNNGDFVINLFDWHMCKGRKKNRERERKGVCVCVLSGIVNLGLVKKDRWRRTKTV
jgi:hypothetical protein